MNRPGETVTILIMSHQRKILIIDDEPDLLDYLSAIFEDNGYEVVTAESGKEGFELARSALPDLITLDITMPDQTGVRTYLDIRKEPDLKDIPVVVITATVNSVQDLHELLDGNPEPEGFLTKPINMSKLLKIMENILTPSD